MTDYLERLFLPEGEKMAAGEEISLPAAVRVDAEAAEFRTLVIPEGEQAEEMSTNPSRDVDVFSGRTVRPGEEVPGEPVLRGEVSHRPSRIGERVEEDLERRLRRDSRRYDSGFYRY